MPFFENATEVTIHGGSFQDIAGNYHHYDNSVVHENSHNTPTTTTTGSYNDSSVKDRSKRDTRNSYKGPTRTSTGFMQQVGKGALNLDAASAAPHKSSSEERARRNHAALGIENAHHDPYTQQSLGLGDNGQHMYKDRRGTTGQPHRPNAAVLEEEASDDSDYEGKLPRTQNTSSAQTSFAHVQSDPTNPASFPAKQHAELRPLPLQFQSDNILPPHSKSKNINLGLGDSGQHVYRDRRGANGRPHLSNAAELEEGSDDSDYGEKLHRTQNTSSAQPSFARVQSDPFSSASFPTRQPAEPRPLPPQFQPGNALPPQSNSKNIGLGNSGQQHVYKDQRIANGQPHRFNAAVLEQEGSDGIDYGEKLPRIRNTSSAQLSFARVQSDPSSATRPAELRPQYQSDKALPPQFKSKNPFRTTSNPAVAQMSDPRRYPRPCTGEGRSPFQPMEE